LFGFGKSGGESERV